MAIGTMSMFCTIEECARSIGSKLTVHAPARPSTGRGIVIPHAHWIRSNKHKPDIGTRVRRARNVRDVYILVVEYYGATRVICDERNCDKNMWYGERGIDDNRRSRQSRDEENKRRTETTLLSWRFKSWPERRRNSRDRLRAIVRRRATCDKNCFSIYDALPRSPRERMLPPERSRGRTIEQWSSRSDSRV